LRIFFHVNGQVKETGRRICSEFNRTDIARYAGMWVSWYVLITKKLFRVHRDIQVNKLVLYKFQKDLRK
jgi:hypothetical protein